MVKGETPGPEEWIDVAEKLIDSGYGLEWNLAPYRPFVHQVFKDPPSTSALDFLYQPVPKELPQAALDLENMRLGQIEKHEAEELAKEKAEEPAKEKAEEPAKEKAEEERDGHIDSKENDYL